MKLRVSNTNAPQWRNLTVQSELPGRLTKLECGTARVSRYSMTWTVTCGVPLERTR